MDQQDLHYLHVTHINHVPVMSLNLQMKSECVNVNVFPVITKNPHPSDNWIIKALFWFVVCWFFFRINLFEKLFQEFVLSGLILVKAVCKSYQQTTLRDTELNDWEFIASTPILCKNNIGETIRVMSRLIRVHTNCNKFKKINDVAQF